MSGSRLPTHPMTQAAGHLSRGPCAPAKQVALSVAGAEIAHPTAMTHELGPSSLPELASTILPPWALLKWLAWCRPVSDGKFPNWPAVGKSPDVPAAGSHLVSPSPTPATGQADSSSHSIHAATSSPSAASSASALSLYSILLAAEQLIRSDHLKRDKPADRETPLDLSLTDPDPLVPPGRVEPGLRSDAKMAPKEASGAEESSPIAIPSRDCFSQPLPDDSVHSVNLAFSSSPSPTPKEATGRGPRLSSCGTSALKEADTLTGLQMAQTAASTSDDSPFGSSVARPEAQMLMRRIVTEQCAPSGQSGLLFPVGTGGPGKQPVTRCFQCKCLLASLPELNAHFVREHASALRREFEQARSWKSHAVEDMCIQVSRHYLGP
ncbi:unnamed protein product [Protopolystoma xenopodis]|uniref:Uncharacterized protein n=1 Tax=Protopolystoma xenopodis TaxID=117903 RepID=A0A448X463_9PLAT|nr:unnamed protein product [Protopolystoma xenopodis]